MASSSLKDEGGLISYLASTSTSLEGEGGLSSSGLIDLTFSRSLLEGEEGFISFMASTSLKGEGGLILAEACLPVLGAHTRGETC